MDCFSAVCTFISLVVAGWTLLARLRDEKWYDAKHVCVWAEGGMIVVQNAGVSPVYDLIITAVSVKHANDIHDAEEAVLAVQEEKTLFAIRGAKTKNREERIKVDVLPPGRYCVVKPSADKRQDHHARYEFRFRDAENRLWLREANGTLHQLIGLSRSLGNYDDDSMPLRSSPLESWKPCY